MALIADIADAVVTALNGQRFSQPVTAERAYRAAFDLQEMKDLHVTVLPKGQELITAGRGVAQSDVQIDIGVQKKLATGDDAEIDELMGLVEEIAGFVRTTRQFADAAWAFERGCEKRFLEAMPIGPAADENRQLLVSADEVQARLAAEFDLTPLGIEHGATALRFRCTGPRGSGLIGFIAPISKPSCGSCGRVRLTADGKLYPCLLDSRFADLRAAWGSGRFDSELSDILIRGVVREKKAQGPQRRSTAMVAPGG
jgi:hypothetical protein